MPEPTIEIGFQIRAIRVTDFTLHEQSMQTNTEVGFGIELQHSHVTDTEEWVVQVFVQVGRSENETPVATLSVECLYLLAGYRGWLTQQSDTNNRPGMLPVGLSATLNSISLSTTRGILFERLAPTQWKHAILPILDPMAFQVIDN